MIDNRKENEIFARDMHTLFMAMILCVLFVFVSTSCRTVKQVREVREVVSTDTVVQIRTEYRDVLKEVAVKDSTSVRDSTYVVVDSGGKPVYVYHSRIEFRDRLDVERERAYEATIDSLREKASRSVISVEKEVVFKPPSLWSRVLQWFGWIGIVVTGVVVLWLLKWVRNDRAGGAEVRKEILGD
jgi:hypothetical protein